MSFKHAIISLVLLFIFTGCYATITGTVVDAETGESIEGALVGGDVEGAVKYFTSESQEKYKAGCELLKDQMANIFNRPEALNLISIIGNVAKYENLVTEDNGKRYSYPVIFIPDENGIWKIKQL